MSVDTFDLEILKALQQNCRMSTTELGNIIGLSPSACQRRIKKLKSEGLIHREVAILNRQRLPGFITVIVDVALEKGGESIIDDFQNRLDKERCVQQSYYVAGPADFVVVVVTRDMEEFDRLSRTLFMSNANVKKFTSKVVITADKVSTQLPL